MNQQSLIWFVQPQKNASQNSIALISYDWTLLCNDASRMCRFGGSGASVLIQPFTDGGSVQVAQRPALTQSPSAALRG